MNRVKILIADNSPTYKKIFSHVFSFELKHVLINSVSNKEELLSRVRLNNYEILVLDTEIMLPNPAVVLQEIIQILPKAIILVTARPAKINEAFFADIAANGTASYLEKPIYDTYNDNITAIRTKVKEMLKNLSSVRKLKKITTTIQHVTTKEIAKIQNFKPELVAIASSTGGPKALERILSKMSPEFSLPILVVQHILPHFAGTLAENLNGKTKLNVKIAEDGEMIEGGNVYIAQSGTHMKLDANKRIGLDRSPQVNGIRPAADVLFESLSDVYNLKDVLTVVLTGMGTDGVRGLSLLKQKRNCICLTQSEKTCIVYGMPRAVVESGLSDMSVDLDDIAGKIESFDAKIKKKD